MKSKSEYEHGVEKPKLAPMGSHPSGMGCHDFKSEAESIAYGQAGKAGCESDMKKINSQMKHYVDDSNSGY